MAGDSGLKLALEAANQASPFHRVTGFTIEEAAAGSATIVFDAAPELMNHAGALHAGVQCAALDTVAGYAAATLAGPVVTLQLSTSFLASAKGERFRAAGRVVKQGKAQLFVVAELFALREGEERLVATASAVLTGSRRDGKPVPGLLAHGARRVPWSTPSTPTSAGPSFASSTRRNAHSSRC